MKYAVIEIGTNTVKYSLFNSKLRLIARELDYLRIGEDIEKKWLSTEKEQKALSIIKIFFNRAKKSGAEKTIILGTSALRNFRNKEDFSKTVKNVFCVPLKILSGEKEAELTFLGASQSLKNVLKSKKGIYLDIGAGSSEIIISEKNNLIAQKSIEIGALSIKEKMLSPFNSKSIILEVKRNLRKNITKHFKDSIFLVGVGGSFTTAASILLKQKTFNAKMISKKIFIPDQFSKLENNLQKISLRTLCRSYNLHSRRADLVQSGIAIINSFIEIISPEKIYVSTEGVSKGIVVKFTLK